MNAVSVQVQQFAVADVQLMAKAISGSCLFGIKTTDQAFALMLIAQAEGRHPATVAQEYDIIQGRPAIKSSAALARFQLAGGKIQWITTGSQEAEAEFSHPLGGTLKIRWDMARAKAAQLDAKDNWKKFPDQMLRARVVAEGVRAVFPACLNGCYLSEEVQDFEPREPKAEARQQNQRKLDPAKAVDQAPPAGSSAPQKSRRDRIHDKYMEVKEAAEVELGNPLPDDFDPSPEWDEASYVNARTAIENLLKAHAKNAGASE